MSNPVRQHYIPRSYLKYFAENREDKFIVDAFLRGEDKQIFTTTTSNVCLQKNIYTFPGIEGDKFALERFYASEVDAVYPDVYRTLVNPNITVLGEEDKRKILNTVLSLFFRTPRFLNYRTEDADLIFDKMASTITDPDQEITIGLIKGETIKFKRKELEEVRQRRKEKIKEEFLINHFADWQDFVKYKMECGMEVFNVSDDVPIITSDNPVMIMNMEGQLNLENIFHHDNIIEIPIDRRTYFVIYPNSVSENYQMRIARSKRDKYFTAGVNRSTEKNSYLQLVSYPGDLAIHFDSQKALGEWNADNVMSFENLIQRTSIAIEVANLIKKNKTAICYEVAQKVKEIRKTKIMDGEEMFEKLILALAKNGYLTV